MLEKKVLFPFLSLILIFFTTQAFTQKAEVKDIEKAVTLSGKVLDANTGKALADVKVNLAEHKKSATTDSEGVFKINDLEPGVYTFSINHDGYQDYRKDVLVRER